jgi:sulfite dehydrogenase
LKNRENYMTLDRREFLKWVAASSGAAAVAGCAGTDAGTRAAKVVVIGGGYGGATAAKFVKLWAPDIDVTIVERNAEFVSCPISNLVLAGNTQLANLTMGYEALRQRGIRIVRDDAVAGGSAARQVRLAVANDARLRPA